MCDSYDQLGQLIRSFEAAEGKCSIKCDNWIVENAWPA